VTAMLRRLLQRHCASWVWSAPACTKRCSRAWPRCCRGWPPAVRMLICMCRLPRPPARAPWLPRRLPPCCPPCCGAHAPAGAPALDPLIPYDPLFEEGLRAGRWGLLLKQDFNAGCGE
jgi:hypothetical protein